MLKLLPTRVMRAFAVVSDHWRLLVLIIALLLFAAIMRRAFKSQTVAPAESSEQP